MKRIIIILTVLLLIVNVKAIDISECSTLNSANTVYYLTTDIINDTDLGECMRVEANNVTLDCQGHMILGYYPYYSGGSSYIVAQIYASNIHFYIKNCYFKYYTAGVYASYSNDICDISNTTIENCGSGISAQCALSAYPSGTILRVSNSTFKNINWLLRDDSGGYHNITDSYFYNVGYSMATRMPSLSYIYDNYIDNTSQFQRYSGSPIFNISAIEEDNIMNGSWTGGNYWETYSYNCVDSDQDGFCDVPYPWHNVSPNEHYDYLPISEYGVGVPNNPPSISNVNPPNNSIDITMSYPLLSASMGDSDNDNVSCEIGYYYNGNYYYKTYGYQEVSYDINITFNQYLNASTQYNWSINCTDGTDLINGTYFFTTEDGIFDIEITYPLNNSYISDLPVFHFNASECSSGLMNCYMKFNNSYRYVSGDTYLFFNNTYPNKDVMYFTGYFHDYNYFWDSNHSTSGYVQYPDIISITVKFDDRGFNPKTVRFKIESIDSYVTIPQDCIDYMDSNGSLFIILDLYSSYNRAFLSCYNGSFNLLAGYDTIDNIDLYSIGIIWDNVSFYCDYNNSFYVSESLSNGSYITDIFCVDSEGEQGGNPSSYLFTVSGNETPPSTTTTTTTSTTTTEFNPLTTTTTLIPEYPTTTTTTLYRPEKPFYSNAPYVVLYDFEQYSCKPLNSSYTFLFYAKSIYTNISYCCITIEKEGYIDGHYNLYEGIKPIEVEDYISIFFDSNEYEEGIYVVYALCSDINNRTGYSEIYDICIGEGVYTNAKYEYKDKYIMDAQGSLKDKVNETMNRIDAYIFSCTYIITFLFLMNVIIKFIK